MSGLLSTQVGCGAASVTVLLLRSVHFTRRAPAGLQKRVTFKAIVGAVRAGGTGVQVWHFTSQAGQQVNRRRFQLHKSKVTRCASYEEATRLLHTLRQGSCWWTPTKRPPRLTIILNPAAGQGRCVGLAPGGRATSRLPPGCQRAMRHSRRAMRQAGVALRHPGQRGYSVRISLGMVHTHRRPPRPPRCECHVRPSPPRPPTSAPTLTPIPQGRQDLRPGAAPGTGAGGGHAADGGADAARGPRC
jgi:hypothetical protein